MSFELYDYQERLVRKARKSIADGSKGVLIQSPPGSGKSIVIAEISRLATLKGSHVLFIVHRQELAQQIEKTFIQNDVDMDHVTIQTVIKAYNRREEMTYPSIIITDETHHSKAETYRKIYDYFDKSFRLGFTATPWRMNGKGFKEIYDVMIQGPTTEWLIENGRLAPYRYFAEDLIERGNLKRSRNGDYNVSSMEEEFNRRRIYGEIVSHYRKHADGKKAIVYAPSIAISQQIAKEFNDAGIKAEHADGKTPPKERERIMSDFRNNRIQVLVNVDLISEGFDVPDCSCVIMARPTKSLVLFIQQAMRGMRYQPDKEAIILDHVGNVHEHGLPDMHREWTIEDRVKKKTKKQEQALAKQCPSCAAWVPTQTVTCPHCETEFEREVSEIEFEDGELAEIKKETFVTNYEEIRFKREWGSKERHELETLEDFYLFAKARNYKETWIKFQMPELAKLNWPQFYIQLNPIKQKHKNKFN